MRIKDIFSPKRWKSFYVHLVRKHLKRIDDSEWTPEVYEVEQFMYRYLRCNECLQKGRCIHCDCKIPERMHVRRDNCSAEKWKSFMTKENWEQYKEDNEIQFILIRNDK